LLCIVLAVVLLFFKYCGPVCATPTFFRRQPVGATQNYLQLLKVMELKCFGLCFLEDVSTLLCVFIG